MLSTGLCAQAACILEASARKPGNVHRFVDFEEVGYVDFLLSGAAIAPALEAAPGRGVGATILACVRATRQVVATNTNLGIVLLLAPLAAVPREEDLRAGVERILAGLTVEDARWAYEGIRLAEPGGLGEAPDQDVHAEPTQTLRAAMALAADRDLIARQYTHDFRDVFDDGVPALMAGLQQTGALEDAIVHAHVSLMAKQPDSLIARKWGGPTAAEAQAGARAVLAAGSVTAAAGRAALAAFDRWLREPGRRRNPGSTADLVAACLFVALRSDTMKLPGHFCSRPLASDDAPEGASPQPAGSSPGRSIAMIERFKVRVTKDHLVFCSGHFISYEGDKCERLHGHNYRATVEVEGSLNQDFYVFDFIALKHRTKAITEELDHRMMLATRNVHIQVTEQGKGIHVRYRDREWLFPREDCVLLPIENTTAELLARYIALRLREDLQQQFGYQAEILRVEVEENIGQSATCELRA